MLHGLFCPVILHLFLTIAYQSLNLIKVKKKYGTEYIFLVNVRKYLRVDKETGKKEVASVSN